MPDQLINWVVTKGAGSMFVGTAITNSSGLSSNKWLLGAGET